MFPRHSLRKNPQKGLIGKPEAYRTVLWQSHSEQRAKRRQKFKDYGRSASGNETDYEVLPGR